MKLTLGSLLTLILIAIKGNSDHLIPPTEERQLTNKGFTQSFASATQTTLLNRGNSTQSAKIIQALIDGGHNSNSLLSSHEAENFVTKISKQLNNPLSVFQSPVIVNNTLLIEKLIADVYCRPLQKLEQA